jgi:hypothetical protein
MPIGSAIIDEQGESESGSKLIGMFHSKLSKIFESFVRKIYRLDKN